MSLLMWPMRNRCLPLAVVLLLICAFTPGCSTAKRAELPDAYSGSGFVGESVVDGKYYTSPITGQTLVSAPKWFPNRGEPPLSSRDALRAATPALAQLVGDTQPWHLQSIKLWHPFDEPVLRDCWLYEVNFDRPGTAGSPGSTVDVYVLMNGRTAPFESQKPTPK